MHARQALVTAALSVALAATPAHADDEGLGWSGLAIGYSKNKFETSNYRWDFTNTLVSVEGYGIAGPAYFKVSHELWGVVGTSSKVTQTEKSTGEVTVGGAGLQWGRYVSDEFFVVLPKLEFGIGFGKALKFTVGGELSDAHAVLSDDSLFFAIDTGIVFGVALVAGSALVIHATLKFNGSFYNQQRHFGDGGGGGFEVVAGVRVAKKLAVFIRTGVEGHTLDGVNWNGGAGGEEDTMDCGSFYFRMGVGYVPIN